MADFFYGRDWLADVTEAVFRGGSAPSSTGYHMILCYTGVGAGNITASMSAATVVATEISGSGYARQNYAPAVGSFDAGQLRYELPSTDLTFTATGGTLSFNAWVLLYNSTSSVGNTSGKVCAYYNYGSTQTIPDGDNRKIVMEGLNTLRVTSATTGTET